MAAAAPLPETDATESGAPQPRAPDVLQSAEALWADMRGIAFDHVQLVALEIRSAGESAVMLLALAVLGGALMAGAGMGLAAALVLALMNVGIDAVAALLIAVALTLVGVLLVVLVIRRQTVRLGFPATMRSLRFKRTTSPEASNSS